MWDSQDFTSEDIIYMEGQGPTAGLDRRRWVISFLPNPYSCLAVTPAGLKAQSLLQGASAISAKGQTQVDIFDLKPQLTAPAESTALGVCVVGERPGRTPGATCPASSSPS